ncbi:tyrosine-type recombinase/integrase [Salmonella enterica]|nr:phage integrase family protein [Salmonella enterica]EEP3373003.1 phage integrase family protein [Salmonella enterica]EFP6579710.1 phage integrase family protein [Salmonella enterica]EGC7970993.1 phage integrase family protein [Salmonella enterica]EIV4461170.1 tyrosine-type recombinase/integrase [Salmonella enterica]
MRRQRRWLAGLNPCTRTFRLTGFAGRQIAEIEKLSHIPPVILQNSHSAAAPVMVAGGWSLDAARTMRDFAAQLGAGMPRYLLAPEVSLLLSYIDDLTARMYFDTLWNTGARLNEALALTPAGFMLEPSRRQPQAAVMLKTLKQRSREASRGRGRPAADADTLHPDPRYRKPPEPGIRLVPLLDAAYVQRMKEFLATWRKRVRHVPVWDIRSRQTPLNWLNAALDRAARDGVTFPINVTPHTFRHSFAMHLLMSGVPEKVLQGLLGHRYARSTEVYTRVFSLDVLTGQGLSFSYDAQTARRLLAR